MTELKDNRPPVDEEDDYDDDPLGDEEDKKTRLESSGLQRGLLPFYLFIFLVWCFVAMIPLTIIYTIVRYSFLE